MIDAFVFLTPILVLCIVALLGFVGCNLVYGVTPINPPPGAPSNLNATAGDGTVQLTWDPSPDNDVTTYHVKRGLIAMDPNPVIFTVTAPATSYTDGAAPMPPLVDGTTYYYRVSAIDPSGESMDSNEAPATPAVPSNMYFISSVVPGTLRNNFTGWVGMVIQVGPTDLMVFGLGRFFFAGNGTSPANTGTHTIKIVDAESGADVPGGSVSVNMLTAPRNANNFSFGVLPSSVTLGANRVYYVVSQETLNSDNFYDDNTMVMAASVATVTGSVFKIDPSPYMMHATGSVAYGPVDFRY